MKDRQQPQAPVVLVRVETVGEAVFEREMGPNIGYNNVKTYFHLVPVAKLDEFMEGYDDPEAYRVKVIDNEVVFPQFDELRGVGETMFSALASAELLLATHYPQSDEQGKTHPAVIQVRAAIAAAKKTLGDPVGESERTQPAAPKAAPSMAERFVAAYDAWEWDRNANEDSFAEWAHKRGLIAADRLAFIQNWSMRPDPKNSILDYAVIDFEDGSMAVRRNHERDGVEVAPWLVLASSDLSRRLRKSIGAPGAFYGTVEASETDKLFIESFGVEVGDYDDKARRFFVKADATAVERLKQFPEDFKLALHHRAAADESDYDPARLSLAEVGAEVAYLNWMLHCPDRARLERDDPARFAEIGRRMAGIAEEAAFRQTADKILAPRDDAGPTLQA